MKTSPIISAPAWGLSLSSYRVETVFLPMIKATKFVLLTFLIVGCSHPQEQAIFVGEQAPSLDLQALPHGEIIEKNIRRFIGNAKVPDRILLDFDLERWQGITERVALEQMLTLHGVQKEHGNAFFDSLGSLQFSEEISHWKQVDERKVFPRKWDKGFGGYILNLNFTNLVPSKDGNWAIFGLSMRYLLGGEWTLAGELILVKKEAGVWEQEGRIDVFDPRP